MDGVSAYSEQIWLTRRSTGGVGVQRVPTEGPRLDSSGSSGEDTVSISEEARELLAAAKSGGLRDLSGLAPEESSEDEDDAEGEVLENLGSAAALQGSSGGGDSGEEEEDEIEKVKEQIKVVQAQIQALAPRAVTDMDARADMEAKQLELNQLEARLEMLLEQMKI